MNNQELFLNNDLLIPVSIGAVILWTIFLFKELPIVNVLRFSVRMVISTLVILCLGLIILVPLIEHDKNTNKLVLLTDGYSETMLDSLKEMYVGSQFLNYSPNNKIVPDSIPASSIHIIGNGIHPYDFWQLENRSVVFVKPEAPTGISKLGFPRSKTKFSNLELQGLFNNSKKGDRIILKDPNGKTIDSVALEGMPTEEFKLNVPLKVSGRFVYSVIEKDSSGIIRSKNPLPIKVEEPAVLKILMLSAFPTFESKYLKNMLTDAKHKLVSRIQLTKGQFKYEYFNTPERPVNSFNGDVLDDFDVIITDYASLQNLNSRDLTILKDKSKNSGLGILLIPETDVFSKSGQMLDFEFKYNGSDRIKLIDLSPFDFENYPYDIKNKNTVVPIHAVDDRVISAFHRYGIGKIGTTTLRNTYRLLLKGQDSIYKQLWSNIISAVTQPKYKKAELIINEDLTFKDEPLSFKLRADVDNPILMAQEGYQLPLRQDQNLPYLWSGITYPKQLGWQNLEIEQDSILSLDYYVFDKTDWKTMEISNRIQENLLNFNKNKSNASKAIIATPLNPIILFIIVVLGLGYLWLVPKLGYSNV